MATDSARTYPTCSLSPASRKPLSGKARSHGRNAGRRLLVPGVALWISAAAQPARATCPLWRKSWPGGRCRLCGSMAPTGRTAIS